MIRYYNNYLRQHLKFATNLVLAVITMSAWAANDNILKFSLDLVGFGDTVVVYRIGHEDVFTGKDGKFEFELKVDTACSALLVQPRLLRNDMDNPQFYSLPLVGGEQVRVWDTTRKRYDVDGTGFYADYHKVDLMIENAGKEQQPLFDYLAAWQVCCARLLGFVVRSLYRWLPQDERVLRQVSWQVRDSGCRLSR